MSRKLTASDRSALIRLASTLPKGSEERRVILAGLGAGTEWGTLPALLVRRLKAVSQADDTKELKIAMRKFLFDVVRLCTEAEDEDELGEAAPSGLFDVGFGLDNLIRQRLK